MGTLLAPPASEDHPVGRVYYFLIHASHLHLQAQYLYIDTHRTRVSRFSATLRCISSSHLYVLVCVQLQESVCGA